MRMESQRRGAIFFVLILHTCIGLHVHVQVSMRDRQTDREAINSMHCECEQWIMQERMKSEKKREGIAALIDSFN